MPNYRIVVEVDPSRAKSGSKAVEGSLDKVERRARSVQIALTRAFAILGIGGGLIGVIGLLANFEQQMSTVKGITGATETQFKSLRDEAQRLGATTRFSASQAAEGMGFLARAGFDVNEVLGATEGTLRLAQAGALDLGSAADIASNVLTGFRLEVDQTNRIVDVLAFTANNANTNVQQLGDGMKFVAPVAAGLGISVETASAAIGALSDAGLQASLAGTGLRRVLSELESPSKKTRDILASVGLTADSVRVSQVGLIAAMTALRDAGVDTGLALEIFGDRGGPAFEVLSTSLPKVQAMETALGGAAGTAEALAAEMDDNLNGSLLATKSAAEALILAFGDNGATGTLRGFFDLLATVLRSGVENIDVLINAITALTIVFGAKFLASVSLSTAELITNAVAQARAAQAAAALTIAQTRMGLAFGPPTAAAIAQTGAMGRLAVAQTAVTATGKGILALFGGTLGLALTAVGAAAYYVYSTVSDADDALASLTISAGENRDQLADLQAKAREAGINVDALGSAAQSSNPLIMAITGAYNLAAQAAEQLGKSARFAAIQVAQGKIVDLKATRDKSLNDGKGFFDTMARGDQILLSKIGIGPSMKDRLTQYDSANAQIKMLTESIDLMESLPESSFDTPKPPAETITGGGGAETVDEKAAKAAAKARKEAADELERQREVLQGFNIDTQNEITLLGLSNREREKQAALYSLESQLGRKLTESERGLYGARLDLVQLARDADYLRKYTEDIKAENTALADLAPGHEARNERLRIERELGRELTPVEAQRILDLNDENKLLRDQADVYDRLNARREEAIRQLGAIAQLEADGKISKADANIAANDNRLVQDLNGLDQSLGGDFQHQSELDNIQLLEDERLRIVQDALEAGLLTKQEAADREVAIEAEKQRQIRDLEFARQSVAIQSAQSTAESLASIAKDLAGEQSAIYRGMFIAAKAFAIADSIIKIQQGIANALSLPFPESLVAAAAVAAQAASIISNIRSVALQLADGGLVRGPGTGTSDSIPANLSNGEYVVNAAATARNLGMLEAMNNGRDPMRFANGGLIAQNDNQSDGANGRPITRTKETAGAAPARGAPQIVMVDGKAPELKVRIVNISDKKEMAEYLATSEGEQVLVNFVNSNPELFARAANG